MTAQATIIGHHLITVGIQAAPMLLLGLVLWLSSASRDIALGWLGVALLLIFAEDLALTGLWKLIPQPDLWGAWNWTGAALALAAMLWIATLKWFGLDPVGVRLYQEEGCGRAWLAALAACLGLLGLLLVIGGAGYQGTDTLIFQTLLVPAQEELFYRGLLFFALDRAFLERRTYYGASVGPAVILSALYFASVHGIVRISPGGGFELRPPLFAATFAAGLFLAWLRARTGSLLAPLLTRMAGNAMLAIL
jgi:membrane protease YdiL (CAAX protease family)